MDNDSNKNISKNKKSKTIKFEDIKQQRESFKSSNNKNLKHNKPSSKNNTTQNKKVISYRITKNKRMAKSVFFKNRSPILIIIAIAIFCFISFAIKNNRSDSLNTSGSNFTSVDPTINQNDFVHYSNIISDDVNKILNMSNSEAIITETMHKNGSEVLAQGYFYWENGEKVYFDITLRDDIPISLLINGREYIN